MFVLLILFVGLPALYCIIGERLQKEVDEARARRIKLEHDREELVKRAKGSQAATQEKRHKCKFAKLFQTRILRLEVKHDREELLK